MAAPRAETASSLTAPATGHSGYAAERWRTHRESARCSNANTATRRTLSRCGLREARRLEQIGAVVCRRRGDASHDRLHERQLQRAKSLVGIRPRDDFPAPSSPGRPVGADAIRDRHAAGRGSRPAFAIARTDIALRALLRHLDGVVVGHDGSPDSAHGVREHHVIALEKFRSPSFTHCLPRSPIFRESDVLRGAIFEPLGVAGTPAPYPDTCFWGMGTSARTTSRFASTSGPMRSISASMQAAHS